MTIRLPYPPSVNNLYFGTGKRRVMTPEGRAFKLQAAAAALRAGVKKSREEIAVELKVFRPRKSGDLDNYFKAVLDSMKGIAWVDDDQVVEIHAFRHDDPSDPRAEITITEAKEQGNG